MTQRHGSHILLCSSRGFFLSELMIVIAIMAIIASVATPHISKARKVANEGSAIASLRTLVSSQPMFYQGDTDEFGTHHYATTTRELFLKGFLGDDIALGAGTKQGYWFEIDLPQPFQFSWSAKAHPMSPKKSGDRSFFVDESGRIRFSTIGPADSSSDEILESCDRTPCSILIPPPPEPDALAAAIWRLGLISPGSIEGAANLFGTTPDLVQIVLSKLDAGGDGLTFSDVLGADLLGVARDLHMELAAGGTTQGKGKRPPREPRIGSDSVMRSIVDAARGRVAASLDLGLPFEELPAVQLPAVQLQDRTPASFLAGIPPRTVEAGLEYLRGFVNELDLGADFVSSDAALNAERKRMLTENAGHMLIALGAGATDVVEEQLRSMLTRVATDQRNSQTRWIKGRRARWIWDQINLTLDLLGTPAVSR